MSHKLYLVLLCWTCPGCAGFMAAAPSLVDAADAALRAELPRASADEADDIRTALAAVDAARAATRAATKARELADASSTKASDAAKEAASCELDNGNTEALALAYGIAADASREAAVEQARAREAAAQVKALEERVAALSAVVLAPEEARDAGAE